MTNNCPHHEFVTELLNICSDLDERYQAILDTQSTLIVRINKEGLFTYVNQAYCKAFGKKREELIGRSFAPLVHPEDLPSTLTAMKKLDFAPHRIKIEQRALTINGWRWILWEYSVVGKKIMIINEIQAVGIDITEQKKAEKALLKEKTLAYDLLNKTNDEKKAIKKSYQETKRILDSISDNLLILDMNGNILEANKATIDFLEYSEKELLGKNVLMLHPKELRQEAMSVIERMIKGQEDTCILDTMSKSGKIVPVETKVTLSTWKDKDVLIAISRDVSERRKKELLLNAQHQELHYHFELENLLLHLSSDLINVTTELLDKKLNNALKMIGTFEKVDRSYIFLFNIPTDEMKNTHEWCAKGIEPQKELLQNEIMSNYHWWISKIYKNETIHIPEVSKLPNEANNERAILEMQSIQSVLVVPLAIGQQILGFLGFDSVNSKRDWSPSSIRLIRVFSHIISNALLRNEQDKRITSSYKRYQNLLNAVPDMLFIIDSQGFIRDFKANREEFLFIKKENIVGSNLHMLFQGKKLQELHDKINQTIQTNTIITFEYELAIEGQILFFEARLSKYSDTEVLAVSTDISQRKYFEQQKSDFIDHIAHELRTPIASTLLMIELIGDEPFDEKNKEYWRLLKNEIQKQRLLIDEFLEIKKIESHLLQHPNNPVNLLEIVDMVLTNFKTHLEKNGVRIILHKYPEIEEDQPILFSNEEGLIHIFNNLISNAIKYSPQNSSITLTIKKSNQHIAVSIKDEGAGIEKKDLPCLFQRFFRGSNNNLNNTPGTGLGLYIVKTILTSINGDIQVQSETGKGSIFTVLLPMEENRNVSEE